MKNIRGQVLLQKRDVNTMDVTYEYEQDNTQLVGMYSNLFEENSYNSSISYGIQQSNNANPYIYISDGTNVLNRFSGTPVTTEQTFNVGGAVISGEYWPQYGQYPDEGYEVYTFKKRFNPPDATRTINTISYYNNYANLPGSRYMAAMRLQTPCIQTPTEILDVYYKIYVYYPDGDKINDPTLNQNFLIQLGQLWRWYCNISNNHPYWEGTQNLIPLESYHLDFMGTSFVNTPIEINSFEPEYSNRGFTGTSNTINRSQGTILKEFNFGLNSNIGSLYSHMAVMVSDRVLYSSDYRFRNYLAIAPIYTENDPFIQSVYLKNALSEGTNFAYLDPSTIGSSTVDITFNDSGWNKQNRPTMFNLRLVDGGDINTASYTIDVSNCFGFASNFFTSENYFNLRAGINYERNPFFPDSRTPHTNNTYNRSGFCIRKVDEEHVLSMSRTGITIQNVYTGNFVNYDINSAPQLETTQIEDSVVAPDGTIYIATTDRGLLRLNASRTNVTQYGGIGSGVTDSLCYTVDVKDNGDVWAMFEGGLCKLTVSTQTWEVYNSNSAISFPASEFNPSWSNTLKISCNKDSNNDMILLSRINSGNLSWWSPDAPAIVNTTGNLQVIKTSGNIRADYHRNMVHVPGTNRWFIYNNQRYVISAEFGTNSYDNVNTRSDNYYFPIMRPIYINNQWNMQVVRNWYQWNLSNIYDEFGAIIEEFSAPIGHNNQYEIPLEVMDDYGTVLNHTINTSYNSTQLYLSLRNLYPTNHPRRWRKYGWDSLNNEWSLDSTDPKPVHTTMDDLFDGIKVSFTPTGGPNDFIAGERWTGYVFRGLHKDNSTEATTAYAQHIRDSYTTSDLETNIIPSSLGQTTEDFNLYTLENGVYSYGGGVSQCYENTSSVANGVDSELMLTGDFNITFNTQQFASTTNNSNSTSYFSLHDMDKPRASTYAFRLRQDGWAVTENDTQLTTPTPLGVEDQFSIRRVGDTITYYVNNNLVYTSSVTSTSTLRGLIRMPSNDAARTYYNMRVSYNETRPALKIGNLLNQTGIYDPRYAMIEAWLSDPHTAKVNIDGVPADILTNPLDEPMPGQVLLLQKSGMLVFHPDDVGKVVTCEVLVLLET